MATGPVSGELQAVDSLASTRPTAEAKPGTRQGQGVGESFLFFCFSISCFNVLLTAPFRVNLAKTETLSPSELFVRVLISNVGNVTAQQIRHAVRWKGSTIRPPLVATPDARHGGLDRTLQTWRGVHAFSVDFVCALYVPIPRLTPSRRRPG